MEDPGTFARAYCSTNLPYCSLSLSRNIIFQALALNGHIPTVSEIPHVIHNLTSTSPSTQQHTLLTYFTPNASFTHPFCRTGSFNFGSSPIPDLTDARLISPHPQPKSSAAPSASSTKLQLNSRQLIAQVYRWYKILSPRIELDVQSVAFDAQSLLLYVSIHQIFRIQLVLFYRADVRLTTLLELTHDPLGLERTPAQLEREVSKEERQKYYIRSQEDLYQTSECVKFVLPWGIGWVAVVLWGFIATIACVLGSVVLAPITWFEEWASKER